MVLSLRPPYPSTDDVNTERARRLSVGTVVTVTGYGDVALQGRQEDMVNLTGLKDIAQMRIAAGDTVTLTKYRDRDNNDHDLAPEQIVELWTSGVAFVDHIYNKSWDLKDLDPIPEDYQNDSYWT